MVQRYGVGRFARGPKPLFPSKSVSSYPLVTSFDAFCDVFPAEVIFDSHSQRLWLRKSVPSATPPMPIKLKAPTDQRGLSDLRRALARGAAASATCTAPLITQRFK